LQSSMVSVFKIIIVVKFCIDYMIKRSITEERKQKIMILEET